MSEFTNKYFIDYAKSEKFTREGRSMTFYQIIALRDIKTPHGIIKKGTKGGMVAGDKILSQGGECWIDEGCYAEITCRVRDNAFVSDSVLQSDVVVEGDAAVVNSKINGTDRAVIGGEGLVINTKLVGGCNISGSARLDTCTVEGYLEMTDESELLRCVLKAEPHNKLSIGVSNKMKDKIISGDGPITYGDNVTVQDRDCACGRNLR